MTGGGNLCHLCRFGDAKVLPAIDVHLRDGFEAVTKALSPGLEIQFNASEWCYTAHCRCSWLAAA